MPYTEREAFIAIAVAVEDPAIEVVSLTLRVPPNALAYQLLIPQGPGRPPIYAKVQLGPGVVIARSFHYSDYAVKLDE